jgi:NSS family neurotransmitter:Na+ symporter
MNVKRDGWGSRIGLVLAMAGNAVGFGNFLRFPIQAISNGGGAFIIPYLICFLLLGIPLLFVEWTIGRYGGKYGHHAAPFIMEKMGKKALWRYIGVFGLFSNLVIASYYCYIESWTLSYVYHSIVGTFQNLSQQEIASFFNEYHDNSSSFSGIPYENLVFFVICLIINVIIISKGLKGGIEKVAIWGIPLLIFLGIVLAIKGVTIREGDYGAVANGIEGLNFLWTPQYTSLLDPKVWFAAAGQIFFTLSVGLGCIQAYASYVRQNKDIALNSLATGFLNEFVEIVLGGTILISISVGFFGLDAVKSMVQEGGGFGIAFQSLPFLFQKWGPLVGALMGISFFGLLFIAGVTSSIAMCTPIVSFLQDNFDVKKRKAAITCGVSVLLCGLPTIFFFKEGVFDEYDYWAGTASLFFFAMMETILFSWVVPIRKNWKEFTRGADIRVPIIFKYILLYITPVLLIIIFLTAFFKPANDDWSTISWKGWEVDKSSILGKIQGKDATANFEWFADTLYAEEYGKCIGISEKNKKKYLNIARFNEAGNEIGFTKSYHIKNNDQVLIEEGEIVTIGTPIASGDFINNTFYTSLARYFLLLLFVSISVLVYIAAKKKKKKKKKYEY